MDRIETLFDFLSDDHLKFMKEFCLTGSYPLRDFHIKFVTERISIKLNNRLKYLKFIDYIFSQLNEF